MLPSLLAPQNQHCGIAARISIMVSLQGMHETKRLSVNNHLLIWCLAYVGDWHNVDIITGMVSLASQCQYLSLLGLWSQCWHHLHCLTVSSVLQHHHCHGFMFITVLPLLVLHCHCFIIIIGIMALSVLTSQHCSITSIMASLLISTSGNHCWDLH